MNDKDVKDLLKAAEGEVAEMCDKLLIQLEQVKDLLLRLMRQPNLPRSLRGGSSPFVAGNGNSAHLLKWDKKTILTP